MAKIPQWLRDVPQDMLPEQYRKFADIIGYEHMLNLLVAYGGEYMYIPKMDAIIKAVRDKKLMEDCRGGLDPHRLARKYDLSMVQVYEIIKRFRTPEEEGQFSFLDTII